MLLLVLPFALANDCELSTLKTELREASPISVPKIYAQLHDCDPAEAAEAADLALGKALGDSHAIKAAGLALSVGAEDAVLSWLGRLPPHERANAVYHFGSLCEFAPVRSFFVDQAAARGETFYTERWHLGLSNCRAEEVRPLLDAALDDPNVGRTSQDRIGFYGLIEVYARNYGVDALPLLEDLAREAKGREGALAVSAFGDAANVGSEDGMSAEAASKAVAILEKLGPDLDPDAIAQARTTLTALGAEPTARSFAAYRWPDLKVDGVYRYFVTARELVTCKNDKQLGVFHYGFVTDPGTLWPDELEAALGDRIVELWGLEAAAKCKGTGDVVTTITALPQGPGTDEDVLMSTHRSGFEEATSGYWKTSVTAHDPASW